MRLHTKACLEELRRGARVIRTATMSNSALNELLIKYEPPAWAQTIRNKPRFRIKVRFSRDGFHMLPYLLVINPAQSLPPFKGECISNGVRISHCKMSEFHTIRLQTTRTWWRIAVMLVFICRMIALGSHEFIWESVSNKVNMVFVISPAPWENVTF